MHVTLRQLQVSEAVARHLSYTRAAVELHLTQPALRKGFWPLCYKHKSFDLYDSKVSQKDSIRY